MPTSSNWNYGQAWQRYTPPNMDTLNAIVAATGNPNPSAAAWPVAQTTAAPVATLPAPTRPTSTSSTTSAPTAAGTDPLALYREQMAAFQKQMDAYNQQQTNYFGQVNAQTTAAQQALAKQIADSQAAMAAWQQQVAARAGSYVPTNAVNTNLANMGNITALADRINALNRQAQTEALNARVPGISQADLLELANIEGAQQYQMPPGLQNVIGQQMAERGVSTGSLGRNVNAGYGIAVTKALLDRADTAGQRLAQLKASNPAAPLYDVSQMMMTPAQAAQLDLERQKLDLSRDELLGSKLMTPAQAAQLGLSSSELGLEGLKLIGSQMMTPAQAMTLGQSNARAMADLAADQQRLGLQKEQLDAAWAIAQTQALNRAASNWSNTDPWANAGYGKGFVMPLPQDKSAGQFDYSKLFPNTPLPAATPTPIIPSPGSTSTTTNPYGVDPSLYDFSGSKYTPQNFPGYSDSDLEYLYRTYGG